MNETERLLFYIAMELVEKLKEHGIEIDGFNSSIMCNLSRLGEIERGER